MDGMADGRGGEVSCITTMLPRFSFKGLWRERGERYHAVVDVQIFSFLFFWSFLVSDKLSGCDCGDAIYYKMLVMLSSQNMPLKTAGTTPKCSKIFPAHVRLPICHVYVDKQNAKDHIYIQVCSHTWAP